jgi:hypothetical protein
MDYYIVLNFFTNDYPDKKRKKKKKKKKKKVKSKPLELYELAGKN